MKTRLVKSLVFLFFLLAPLYAFEFFLERADPRRRLPPDGIVDGRWYTWGHIVEKNSLGFREREVGPKAEGTFRVMVLGDSLTWGAGLAPEERYTALLERRLREAHPDKRIEVLNFGLPGAPTTRERDVLLEYGKAVSPDLVVVGFCVNDPQPKAENYSPELDRFEARYGRLLTSAEYRLSQARLHALGALVRKAALGLAEKTGAVPATADALARAYDDDSPEWREFVAALRDIKRASDEAGLPAPVFAALNQSARVGRDYNHPDEFLSKILALTRKAEQAARAEGFVVLDYEKEIPLRMADEATGVNELDGHPSARLNQLYAEKLYGVIEETCLARR
ncbi:MAG TPA: SGNH/GDSL hydrolase family protein [Pyrinomonadaceae bacterium]|nr:SGNH/GDSL hydrolase family protein [Pyrinomonadaceae bacterium]